METNFHLETLSLTWQCSHWWCTAIVHTLYQFYVFVSHFFFLSAHHKWNALPSNIISSNSLESLKQTFKQISDRPLPVADNPTCGLEWCPRNALGLFTSTAKQLKATAYLSLVRPTLEYAASVGDPRLVKYLNSIEAVQRKASRFVYGDYRRRAIRWKTLEARRRDTRLQLMYNITNKNTAVSAEEIGMVEADGLTKANHRFKFRAIGPIRAQLHGSFVDRTIAEWKRLPADAADAVSPTSFHSQLDALPATIWPCGL